MNEEKHREYLDEHHICWAEGGTLHVDAVKACQVFGFPPTDANQQKMIKSILKVTGELLPKAKKQIVDDSTRCSHEFVGSNTCALCGWSLDQGGPMGGA